jgi:hypothetical protein
LVTSAGHFWTVMTNVYAWRRDSRGSKNRRESSPLSHGPLDNIHFMYDTQRDRLFAEKRCSICHYIYNRKSTNVFFQPKLFLGACEKLRKATVSFVMSVRPSVRPSAWSNSTPTGQIFTKFDIRELENFSKVYRENSGLIKTWHEERVLYVRTYWSRWISLKVINVSHKIGWENQYTHHMLNNSPPPLKVLPCVR